MTTDKARPMALVVGALSGAGQDLCRELARRHFDLLLMDLDGSGLFHLRKELQAASPVHVQLFQGHVERQGHRQELQQVLHTVGVKLDVVLFIPGLEAKRERNGAGGEARQGVEKGHLALDDLLLGGILPAMVQEGNGYVLSLVKASLLDPHCPLAAPAAAAAALALYSQAMSQAWSHAHIAFTVGILGKELETWCDPKDQVAGTEVTAAKKLLAALFSRKELVKAPRWHL